MFQASVYKERRKKLWDLVSQNSKNPCIIVSAFHKLNRSPDIPYLFRQNGDMLYLTGYDKPTGHLGIVKDGTKIISTLFLPQPNPSIELWEGFMERFEDIKKKSAVDQVLPIQQFEKWQFYQKTKGSTFYQSDSKKISSLSPYIDKLRVIKSKKEIEYLKKSSEISKSSIKKLNINILESISPLSLIGQFEFNCYKNGATGISFPTFIKKMRNSLILNGGCEYNHYCSEISNTKSYSSNLLHQNLTEMIQDINKSLIKMIKKRDLLTINDINKENIKLLQNGFKKFKFDSISSEMIKKIISKDSLSWIGLDINECKTISSNFRLQKGCCLVCKSEMNFSNVKSGIPNELKDFHATFSDTVILE